MATEGKAMCSPSLSLSPRLSCRAFYVVLYVQVVLSYVVLEQL